VKDGAKVSRYEQFVRDPGLETALACEVIFERPARELFAGLYQQIEQEVAERAKVLARKMDCETPDAETVRKLQTLARLAGPQTK